MFTLIFITLFLLAFSFICFHYNENFRNDALAIIGGWSITFGICSFLFTIIGGIGSYSSQIHNVESIQSNHEKIEVQEDRLDRLSTILNNFDYPDSNTLANSDTPIGSVIQQMSDVERDIANRKEKIIEFENRIRQRKAWFFGFTTNLHPLDSD